MTLEEIRAELKRQGTEIGHYHQLAEVPSAPAALQGQIYDGFCSGACLDWVRCVLHGGSAAKGPEVLAAGLAYVAQGPVSRKAHFDDLQAKVQARRAEDASRVNQEIAALHTKAQEIMDEKSKGLTQQEYDALFEKVQARVSRVEEELRAGKEARNEQYSTLLTPDVALKLFWQDFGKLMDKKLGQTFGNQRFSKLTVAGASKNKVYGPPNGLKQLILATLTDAAFSAGNAVVLGIYPGPTGNGHAIAIQRLNTGDYHLFDPNLGIYRLDHYHLCWVFLFLFLKGYPSLEGGSKTYETNGKVNGEYVIYKGLQSSPPAVSLNPSPGLLQAVES